MKLVQVAEENKRYYTKEFIHGFNTGAKTQLEADKKEAERRGRWINGNEGIWNAVILPKCSICGETFYEMNVNINGEYPYNYCPNCGASMMDEVEE